MPAADAPQTYVCPNCSLPVELTPSNETAEWACPHCGGVFVVASPSTSTDDDQADDRNDDAADDDSNELDGVRIRQLSQARRATYRSRSFCLIGAMACLIGVIELSIHLARTLARHEVDWTTGVVVVLDVLMGWASLMLFGKARYFHEEARRSSLSPPPPDHPPDFSTLSDGSQKWKDLENIR